MSIIISNESKKKYYCTLSLGDYGISYPLISKGLFGKKVDSITMTTNKYLLVPVLFAHIKICVLEY